MSASVSVLHQSPASLPVSSNGQKQSPTNREANAEPWEWAKLRKIALHQMDKFIDLFPLVLRNEDLTAVNLMRITCRRLEQILELVYAKPRPRHIKKLHKRLRLCRRTLGRLRDCDALLVVAEHSIAAKRPDSDAWEILRQYLHSLRGRTAENTLKRLGRVNLAVPYLRVKRDFDLDSNASHNGNARATASRNATEIVYKRILRSLDGRWCEFAVAVEKSHTDPCEHVIHRMRIAAKRLRYLTEVMAKLHIEGSKEALTWLKSLQRTVGVWHDLEIMERLLRNILAHRKFFHIERLSERHIENLIRHNRVTKKESAARFFAMTRHSREYLEVKKWTSEVLAGKVLQKSSHQAGGKDAVKSDGLGLQTPKPSVQKTI
jgi:CHAD domain-containing protein